MKSVEKKHRRFLAAILALCLLLGLCPFDLTARAEESTKPLSAETQNAVTNTSMETAKEVSFDEEVKYELSADVEKQWFKVTMDKPYQALVIEGDLCCSVYESDGKTSLSSTSLRGDGKIVYVRKQGTYYICVFRAWNDTSVKNGTFTLRQIDNDQYEPNDTMEEAKEILENEQYGIVPIGQDKDWFKFTTTKPGQIVQLKCSESKRVLATCYDAAGRVFGHWIDNEGCFSTGEAGVYYLCFEDYASCSGGGLILYDDLTLVSISLFDGDSNEPNNTKETATTLNEGAKTEFTLAAGDYDYFKITTTKPGQDIALTVSGYDYTNKDQKIQLVFDPGSNVTDRTACGGYATLSGDSTLYFHAAEAGEHYVALYMYENNNTNAICTRTLTAQILDGDRNEPNETKATATRLTVGTDQDFTVGGFGDEDWFAFEAVPGEGEKKLYTLRFTGLNTDYSDSFYYDLYAPNGAAVVKQAKVNIQHVYGFSCDQQGQYYVRVYAGINGKGYMGNYPRSLLRICVSEGGDDPYESNDTWQTAASIPVGDIQHVLASTTDADWFCFTVPENDMTLHLTGSKRTNAVLYKAETLMQNGEDESYNEFYDKYDRTKYFGGRSDLYWKLTDNGVYYLKLTAESSYASADLRTTGLELLPAMDEENNDTWKKATPLYEGVPQRFTISASNDVEWFKIIVPKDGVQLYFPKPMEYSFCCIYEERAFETAGDDAASIDSFNRNKDYANTTKPLSKGTYYLEVNPMNDIGTESLMVYKTLPAEWGTSLETARQLGVGEWAEYYNSTYFCIGERKAGEVVRISLDAAKDGGQIVRIVDEDGNIISTTYYSSNRTFTVPKNGIYYLYADASRAREVAADLQPYRIRYDVGSGEEKVFAIECVDPLTLIEGERMFLDLRCAPYDAMNSGSGDLFNVNTPDCVEYSGGGGYLTAKEAGSGTLTVSLSGDSSVKKEISVTVLAKDSLSATSVTIPDAPDMLPLGASADLTANYTLAGSVVLTNPQKAVTWTSSDPKVLYVSPGGKVTAVGSGSATVTASVGGASVAKTITVTAAEEPKDTVTSITLNKYSLTLYVGEMGEQLAATILPEGSTASVVWQSSNPNVATVTEKGLVQAVTPGTSVITATAGGRHVSCIVSVLAARVRVTGVSFDETEHKIPVRGTAKLTATIAPADATVKTLVWTSDDSGIASVSRTGIVTAVSVGTTKIHATSVDGNHSAEITVTVTPNAELGDVNGDGYIDSADAMLCLRYSVGLKELTKEQKRAANVNHDSFVDAGDAIKILRYDAKLIGSLN